MNRKNLFYSLIFKLNEKHCKMLKILILIKRVQLFLIINLFLKQVVELYLK